MNKSDKELAVELTCEFIRANPRTLYQASQMNEKIMPSMELDVATAILEKFYDALKSLD